MKKLLGFTLAEVLVTLGIIGVVAALTTPTLVANINRQGYATALKTTVSDLQNAFATAMEEQNASGLNELPAWSERSKYYLTSNSSDHDKNLYYDFMRKYLKLKSVFNAAADTYYTSYGTNSYSMNKSGGIGSKTNMDGRFLTVELKNGATVFYVRYSNTYTPEFAGEILIDVNGAEGPNVFARDIHRFVLSDDGKLEPYGSPAANILMSGSEDGGRKCFCCSGQKRPDYIDSGLYTTCTYRLVRNNYVFDY